jgi:hypothetical protein
MIILVAASALGALLLSYGLGAYLVAEYVRKKTERSIAVYYRDFPLECTMMLNKISLVETRKEIAEQKMKHGNDNRKD